MLLLFAGAFALIVENEACEQRDDEDERRGDAAVFCRPIAHQLRRRGAR